MCFSNSSASRISVLLRSFLMTCSEPTSSVTFRMNASMFGDSVDPRVQAVNEDVGVDFHLVLDQHDMCEVSDGRGEDTGAGSRRTLEGLAVSFLRITRSVVCCVVPLEVGLSRLVRVPGHGRRDRPRLEHTGLGVFVFWVALRLGLTRVHVEDRQHPRDVDLECRLVGLADGVHKRVELREREHLVHLNVGKRDACTCEREILFKFKDLDQRFVPEARVHGFARVSGHSERPVFLQNGRNLTNVDEEGACTEEYGTDEEESDQSDETDGIPDVDRVDEAFEGR